MTQKGPKSSVYGSLLQRTAVTRIQAFRACSASTSLLPLVLPRFRLHQGRAHRPPGPTRLAQRTASIRSSPQSGALSALPSCGKTCPFLPAQDPLSRRSSRVRFQRTLPREPASTGFPTATVGFPSLTKYRHLPKEKYPQALGSILGIPWVCTPL